MIGRQHWYGAVQALIYGLGTALAGEERTEGFPPWIAGPAPARSSAYKPKARPGQMQFRPRPSRRLPGQDRTRTGPGLDLTSVTSTMEEG